MNLIRRLRLKLAARLLPSGYAVQALKPNLRIEWKSTTVPCRQCGTAAYAHPGNTPASCPCGATMAAMPSSHVTTSAATS